MAPYRLDTLVPRARTRDLADARRVLRTLRAVKNGMYWAKKGGPGGKYLIQRVLRYPGYRLLQEVELRKEENKELRDYIADKLCFDYLRHPCRGDKQFLIHLPSTFHSSMAGRISDEIIKWLGRIEAGVFYTTDDNNREETEKVATKIHSSMSRTVMCDEPRGDRLDPDLSFTYGHCFVAGLLVEVAWSQSNLRLPDRAKRYIEGKNGKIRTVVGLNMKSIYQGGCRATFSIWKARLLGNTWTCYAAFEDQEFLDENGQAIDSCVLPLSLKDFLCEEKVLELGEIENVPLEIPSTKLRDFYKEAFWQHVMDEVQQEMGEVMKKSDDVSTKIILVKTMIQEQGMLDSRKGKMTGKQELVELNHILSDFRQHADEMKSKMEDVKKKMNMVYEPTAKIERLKAQVETRLEEVEEQIAETRRDVGKMFVIGGF